MLNGRKIYMASATGGMSMKARWPSWKTRGLR
jgi:hypothetical protein